MEDLFGLVPPHIKANAEREQMIDQHLEAASQLTRALKAFDPQLEVVWVGERAPVNYGWIPGRWHVRRVNVGTSDTYMPITKPDGSYMEPHSGVVEEVKKRDMWRNGALDNVAKIYDEVDKEKEAAQEIQHLARQEELAGRVKAEINPGVSMSGSWSKSKRGAKGTKGVVGS
jgi:hypothetical protein